MSLNTESVVVVAGAGGGAGGAVIRALTASGATVIGVDTTTENAERGAALAVEPGRAVAAAVDLLDADATKAFAEDLLKEHGRVDGVIHLVGGWRGSKTFGETKLEDWALLHKLLIQTTQNTSLAFHQALDASGDGRFVLISATAASAPTAGNAAYGAAKAAAEAWTLALADGFKKDGDNAAAVVLVVKALLTDAMKEAKPEGKFPGYTHVDDLAAEIVKLFGLPAAEVNGTRVRLAP
ncbi:NAD(P)-dependent dehydrogenase (short-subunit alcohol dehydrogenase family) [Catenulispora sp. MAP12-49]|uniref:SDR family NAD(P)-dependent oxidoreductase n=1 Tax=unclassified Catenulispora TaxID=414885 RepID=UPI0035186771